MSERRRPAAELVKTAAPVMQSAGPLAMDVLTLEYKL